MSKVCLRRDDKWGGLCFPCVGAWRSRRAIRRHFDEMLLLAW